MKKSLPILISILLIMTCVFASACQNTPDNESAQGSQDSQIELPEESQKASSDNEYYTNEPITISITPNGWLEDEKNYVNYRVYNSSDNIVIADTLDFKPVPESVDIVFTISTPGTYKVRVDCYWKLIIKDPYAPKVTIEKSYGVQTYWIVVKDR